MPKQTIEERFWAKVDRQGDDKCWLWTGRTNFGYGSFWNGKRQMPAHRFAYELLVGPIPDGLTIDHLCRVRGCVNPSHLEPVTNKTNVLRGVGVTAQNARKTHCKRGHEFTPENTYRRPADPVGRWCRECRRMYDRLEWKRGLVE